MTNIGVIGGAGYVGLVTGVGLAALGHKVTSMDLDQSRIQMLREGSSAVYEKCLEVILRGLIAAHKVIRSTQHRNGLFYFSYFLLLLGRLRLLSIDLLLKYRCACQLLLTSGIGI